MTAERHETEPAVAPSASDLLRDALVDDEDPRFPWWLPLPGIGLALLWAAYQAATAGAGVALEEASGLEVFARNLLWPGAAIFIVASLATLFGWQLDID